jgi:hypothetical protein
MKSVHEDAKKSLALLYSDLLIAYLIIGKQYITRVTRKDCDLVMILPR